MAKKPTPRLPKGRLVVRSSDGSRQRFLRGMITHDLVQRGLDFEQAYEIADQVRERLSERDEVTTSEVRQLLGQLIADQLGPEARPVLDSTAPSAPLLVDYRGISQPFSRGLLARSIYAAGLALDRAYEVVGALEDQLREENCGRVSSPEIVDRVVQLLEEREGSDTARRYRLVRRIHQLPLPLVIYVGGASGTGKSTLSLELAPILRIYRINATDTIRQVMRMVFSRKILPSIHSSSFTPHFPPNADEELEPQVLASFEEQASRVTVGVRAVVERAIAEHMSVLVEGVHLYPPLIPFADLEGACYQIPIMLGTLDPEVHRNRFQSRARVSGRRADRYLENFDSIRMLHDFVLHQAESYDAALLDTSEGEPPVAATVQVITAKLQRELPGPGVDLAGNAEPLPPTLLLILDGLADRPVRSLGGRTPLQAASIPTFDRLAREGRSGLADPVAPDVVPDTAAGSLALLGQNPRALQRGPVEALGADLEVGPGAIALRANLATLDDKGRVADRRAGRIRKAVEELAAAIDDLVVEEEGSELRVRVAPGTEHRLAIVLDGDDLSSAIQGSDPGESAIFSPPLVPRALDPQDPQATRTARLLAIWELEVRKILAEHAVNRKRRKAGLPEANCVLTRGPGRLHRLRTLAESGFPHRLACVAGDRTLLGLVRWLGGDTITSEAMTANLDTDLEAKFEAAAEAFDDHDLVVLHLKGADIAAHDRRPDLKVRFLEQVDRELGRLLKRGSAARIVVAADHATLSESGQHAADPVPVLFWGEGVAPDEVEAFDEAAAAEGGMGRLPLQGLLGRVLSST